MRSIAPDRSVPRLALTVGEAAQSVGVSDDFFHQHIAPHLRWVRIGRKKLVRIAELERFLAKSEALILEETERP